MLTHNSELEKKTGWGRGHCEEHEINYPQILIRLISFQITRETNQALEHQKYMKKSEAVV